MVFILKALLVFYNLVLTSTLLFFGLRGSTASADGVLALFLFPVVIYFFSVGIGKFLAVRGLSTIKKLTFGFSLATTSVWFLSSLWVAGSSEYLFVLLIAPLPIYFWGVATARFIRSLKGSSKKPKEKEEPVIKEEEKEEALAPTQMVSEDQVNEPSRRDFLKRIGSIGLGILVWSLLNPKQAGAAFFGSVPGPGTVALKDTTDTKIDPAIKSPTDAYGITEIDEDAPNIYYGFINKDGKWYILKETESDSDFSYRYVKGDTDFPSNWGSRKTRTDYNYFDQTF